MLHSYSPTSVGKQVFFKAFLSGVLLQYLVTLHLEITGFIFSFACYSFCPSIRKVIILFKTWN